MKLVEPKRFSESGLWYVATEDFEAFNGELVCKYLHNDLQLRWTTYVNEEGTGYFKTEKEALAAKAEFERLVNLSDICG